MSYLFLFVQAKMFSIINLHAAQVRAFHVPVPFKYLQVVKQSLLRWKREKTEVVRYNHRIVLGHHHHRCWYYEQPVNNNNNKNEDDICSCCLQDVRLSVSGFVWISMGDVRE